MVWFLSNLSVNRSREVISSQYLFVELEILKEGAELQLSLQTRFSMTAVNVAFQWYSKSRKQRPSEALHCGDYQSTIYLFPLRKVKLPQGLILWRLGDGSVVKSTAALPEELSLVPSIHIRASHLLQGTSYPFLASTGTSHTHIYIHAQIHIYT